MLPPEIDVCSTPNSGHSSADVRDRSREREQANPVPSLEIFQFFIGCVTGPKHTNAELYLPPAPLRPKNRATA